MRAHGGCPGVVGGQIKTRAVGSIRMRLGAVGSMMIVRFGEAEGCSI